MSHLNLHQTYTLKAFFHFRSIRREQSHQSHSSDRTGLFTELDPCGIAHGVSDEWTAKKKVNLR